MRLPGAGMACAGHAGPEHRDPGEVGGADVLENFQALCWRCNTNKGAGDDTDCRDTNQLTPRAKLSDHFAIYILSSLSGDCAMLS